MKKAAVDFADIHNASKVHAKDVSRWIQGLLRAIGVSERAAAQGLNIAESQFTRMAHSKNGHYRTSTLEPIERLEKIYKEARETLTETGARRWLTTPNPYLNDVPPVLCLRSDKEMEKVVSLLASVRYGFAA